MKNMFNGCSNLESIDLSSFIVSKVEDLSYMFRGCTSLNSLNLSTINTQSVTTMEGMFYNCKNLVNLDISRFSIPFVTTMKEMFYSCSSIKSLNLSNFISQSAKTMEKMFYKCSNLESLYINNFETSEVETMAKMFYECTSLKSLNISNFNTRSVTTMSYMFYKCQSLETLIITNFNFNNLFFNDDLDNGWFLMFYSCLKLEYVDMKNAIESSSKNYINILGNIRFGSKFCINLEQLSIIKELITESNGIFWCNDEVNNEISDEVMDKITYKIIKEITYEAKDEIHMTSLYNQNCPYYYYLIEEKNEIKCTDGFHCPENYPLLVPEKSQCRKNCKDDTEFKYEFQGKCHKMCPNNTKISENIIYFCEISCSNEYPLKMIDNQECSNHCHFNDLINNDCVPGYNVGDLDINKDNGLINSMANIFTEYITLNNFDSFDLETVGRISYNFKNFSMEIVDTETEKNNNNSTDELI